MTSVISGVKIPDSKLAREAAELVRSYEDEMLFNHSVRVYVFGAMKGLRQKLKFDPSCFMSRRCFTTSAWSITTTPKQSDLRSTVPTPRGTFSGHAASPSRRPIWSGRRLRCTPHPVFRNI